MKQVSIALDCFLNALCGGWGDETLSEHAWRQHLYGNPVPARYLNRLFFWQVNHCLDSYNAARRRRSIPPEAR